MLVDSNLLPNMFLPPTLQDLLLREAVFQLSRRRLEEALAVVREELAGIQVERPRLSFVRKEARRAHQSRIE
jgi:CRISPR/Cas system-associated protein Csm6